ncbi:MAG: hypothetical protein K2N73_13950 [Lachnospiraceae bacterium]|nr:hypothetical protein [Lachnospiraceae bacterium]
MNEVKSFIKADRGRLTQVIEYGTGTSVEIPLNSDGSVRWYNDKSKKKQLNNDK